MPSSRDGPSLCLTGQINTIRPVLWSSSDRPNPAGYQLQYKYCYSQVHKDNYNCCWTSIFQSFSIRKNEERSSETRGRCGSSSIGQQQCDLQWQDCGNDPASTEACNKRQPGGSEDASTCHFHFRFHHGFCGCILCRQCLSPIANRRDGKKTQGFLDDNDAPRIQKVSNERSARTKPSSTTTS